MVIPHHGFLCPSLRTGHASFPASGSLLGSYLLACYGHMALLAQRFQVLHTVRCQTFLVMHLELTAISDVPTFLTCKVIPYFDPELYFSHVQGFFLS